MCEKTHRCGTSEDRLVQYREEHGCGCSMRPEKEYWKEIPKCENVIMGTMSYWFYLPLSFSNLNLMFRCKKHRTGPVSSPQIDKWRWIFIQHWWCFFSLFLNASRNTLPGIMPSHLLSVFYYCPPLTYNQIDSWMKALPAVHSWIFISCKHSLHSGFPFLEIHLIQ